MTARRLMYPSRQECRNTFPISGRGGKQRALQCRLRLHSQACDDQRFRKPTTRTHICSSDPWLFVRLCVTGFSGGLISFPLCLRSCNASSNARSQSKKMLATVFRQHHSHHEHLCSSISPADSIHNTLQWPQSAMAWPVWLFRSRPRA